MVEHQEVGRLADFDGARCLLRQIQYLFGFRGMSPTEACRLRQ
jgi:hypothetical protein